MAAALGAAEGQSEGLRGGQRHEALGLGYGADQPTPHLPWERLHARWSCSRRSQSSWRLAGRPVSAVSAAAGGERCGTLAAE